MQLNARLESRTLATKLARARAGVARATSGILPSVGRIACISMAKSTVPFGTGAAAQNLGQNAVARDIRKIYAVPRDVYSTIQRNSGNDTVKAFYAFCQRGNVKRAAAILAKFGGPFADLPIVPFDPAWHADHRNPRTGRVPRSQQYVVLVINPTALRRYILSEQKRVGFAKSAWAGAARELGGIRGLRSGRLASGQADITANWITRQKAPFRIIQGEDTLTISSEVSYADRALAPGAKGEALRIAYDRADLAARHAAAAELKKAVGH